MSLSDFLLNLAGKAEQAELNVTVAARLGLEQALATAFGVEVVQAIVTGGKQGLFTDTEFLTGHFLELVEKAESPIGKAIFRSLVAGPMGVNLDAVTPENRQGVDTIERVIGFATELSLGTAAIAGALEPLLGNHALKGLLEAVRQVPGEIGLNYFMGTVMANVFETSTGTPLREAISQQVRPARLEWPQISKLLKMHHIERPDAIVRLQKAGFRDDDIDLLDKLSDQLLSISDVQELANIGYFNSGQLIDYLERQGIPTQDIGAMLALTHHKAATEGASSFRTIARAAYLNSHIGEQTYRGLLKEAETPQESIDLLVAGVKLERDAGRLHLSVAEVKDLFQNGHIDNNEVRQRLANLGFSDADIADLIIVWNDAKKVARSGIGTAKILGYLIGGVIDKQTAYNLLVRNGVAVKDAQFLVDHPTTHPQVSAKPVNAGTIIAAYKDDVLTRDQTESLLKARGTNPEQAFLLLANADAQVTRGKKPKKPTKSLSETNVLEALKLGLANATWAERELETLGWATADAVLLVTAELTKLDSGYPGKAGWQVLT